MLVFYRTRTLALMQAPSSPVPLIDTSTIDSYVNTARLQVAADGECIRFPATVTVSAQSLAFSGITTNAANGVGSVLTVRSLKIGNRLQITIRSWEWFAAYNLSMGRTGTPLEVAQQGQGINGTLFFDPAPTAPSPATIDLDTVCLPIVLLTDATVEAIPPLWTEAVPFYAAWLGLMSLQRQAAANVMMERYKEQMRRARQLSTPSELPDNLPGGAGAQAAAAHGSLSQAGGAAAGQR